MEESKEEAEAALQKKYSSIVEQLNKRHQSRSDNNNESESSSSPAFESTSSFLTRFSNLKSSIESQLTHSHSVSSSDPSQLKPQFEQISTSISHLQKLVAENSYFLPSYDVRSSLKTIADLTHTLETLISQFFPKKKFSFKNKAATKKDTTNNNTPLPLNRDSPGFRNKSGELLVGDFRGLEVGKFTVSDLNSCEVRIIGCVRMLFVHRLKDSRVYVEPVMGSVYIEDVEGCVFAIASHQIRIHAATRSDFYLRVKSRPIIEDSNEVRFVSYYLRYEGIKEDLCGAGLDAETRNWGNVDDFKWLRAV
ncbi:tubulin-folding cofactor C-like [Arachis hypogaea]|uniref:tubulin-folding cofactor C-like n=1 Tax=Arachis hypogaea TaxID=3818 RepID=UPI000DED2848|nr:tubulin-folding cofactor C-like [Arachis hypogaea]